MNPIKEPKNFKEVDKFEERVKAIVLAVLKEEGLIGSEEKKPEEKPAE